MEKTIKINVDVKELDVLNEKVNQLVNSLSEANKLIDSLLKKEQQIRNQENQKHIR